MTSTQKTLLCHYRYDPLDRLINHTRADAPTQQRFYCKSRLATEIQGAMQHSIIQHGDLLLAQQQRLGDEVSATLLATDLQRSVLHTLEKNHQRQAIAYSPYGHRRAESGLTRLLGFNGERPDPLTEHYLLGNGYRAFNPVMMRFNSPDNLSPFGSGGLNPYTYCLGDPRNRHDPSGQTSANIFSTFIIAKKWLSRARADLALSPEKRMLLLEDYNYKTISHLRRTANLQHLEIASPGFINGNRQPLSLKHASAFAVHKANLPLDSLPPPIIAQVKEIGPIGQFKPILEHFFNPRKKTGQSDFSDAIIFGVYTPRNAPPHRKTFYAGSKIKEYDSLLPQSYITKPKILEQGRILESKIRSNKK
jgi:RHS repeat-associated protein